MKTQKEIQSIINGTYGGDTPWALQVQSGLAREIWTLMVDYREFGGTNFTRLQQRVTNTLWEVYAGGTTAQNCAERILEGFESGH